MSVRDDLIAAKALIDTPEKWSVLGAIGALQLATDRNSGGRFTACRAALRSAYRGPNISTFERKARTTHADIMALFDRAIAAAEPTP